MKSILTKITAACAVITTLSNVPAHAAENSAKPAAAAPAASDAVVAKGKTFEIRKSELDEAFRQASANAKLRGQAIPDEQRPAVEAQLLDRLVITRVLLAKATPDDKTAAGKSTDEFIANARKQSGTEEVFKQQLQQSGLTLDSLRSRYAEQATVERVLERDIESMIKITDEQAKEFYEKNAARFTKPEQVRASHILIATQDLQSGEQLSDAKKKEKKELTEKLLARAKKGEDFAKLAKEFSDDPGSKDKGGEYTFPRGQMVPEFEAAAFALKTNEVSGIVTTQYGYHIIKLSEKIAPEKVEYAKVAEDLKKNLMQQEFQSRQAEYFAKLKSDAGVSVVGAAAPAAPAPAKP